MGRRISTLTAAFAAVLLMTAVVQACDRSADSNTGDAGSGDGTFRQLANEIMEFTYESDPSNATYLGIHRYGSKIRDYYSAAGIEADVERIKGFRTRLKEKMGDSYSLKGFHDEFIRLAPLPLPLIRKAMLGEVGDPF